MLLAFDEKKQVVRLLVTRGGCGYPKIMSSSEKHPYAMTKRSHQTKCRIIVLGAYLVRPSIGNVYQIATNSH